MRLHGAIIWDAFSSLDVTVATLIPYTTSHLQLLSFGQLKESDGNTVTGCICVQRWRKEERRRVERKWKMGRWEVGRKWEDA